MALKYLLVSAGLLAAAAVPARAETIAFGFSYDHSAFGENFYIVDSDDVDSLSFILPAGFSNAVLSIQLYVTDDRSVMRLNGTDVASFGIGAAKNGGAGTPGFMFFSAAGPGVPYTFLYGTLDDPTATNNYPAGYYANITGPFQVGVNEISFIANDTAFGMGVNFLNPFSQKQTGVAFEATLTYDLPQVPIPAALPLFAGGLGVVALIARRKRRNLNRLV